MKKHSYILSAIIILLLFWGCKKKEERDYNYHKIRVINHTDFMLDNLKIHYTTSYTGEYSRLDSIMINNLEISDTSSYELLEKCSGGFYFSVIVNVGNYGSAWYYPNTPVDPTDFYNIPEGRYTLSITNIDTVNSNMSVGLIEFREGIHEF